MVVCAAMSMQRLEPSKERQAPLPQRNLYCVKHFVEAGNAPALLPSA